MKSLFISLLIAVSIFTIGCEVDSTNPTTNPEVPQTPNPDAGQFKLVVTGIETEVTDGRYLMATFPSQILLEEENQTLTFSVGTTEYVFDGVFDSEVLNNWYDTISAEDGNLYVAVGQNGGFWPLTGWTISNAELTDGYVDRVLQINDIEDKEQIIMTYDYTEQTVTVERYGEYL